MIVICVCAHRCRCVTTNVDTVVVVVVVTLLLPLSLPLPLLLFPPSSPPQLPLLPPSKPLPHPSPPLSIHHCSHHLPHTLVIRLHPPLWSCGRRRSLASHHPPLMLPMLVDCCFSPILWTREVWGFHLPLLFSRLVLVQHCQNCRVATAGTTIPVLASGQFWPSPSPGACTTGATLQLGGRVCMPSFGATFTTLAMVPECFCCDERSS